MAGEEGGVECRRGAVCGGGAVIDLRGGSLVGGPGNNGDRADIESDSRPFN